MTGATELPVEEFAVRFAETDLANLRDRLDRTRWPVRESAAGWEQGVPLGWLTGLCEEWRTGYDWRACEARINAWPNIRTRIDGVDIHAIHARSHHPDAVPLVLTHGWPGSVLEFLEVIGPLTDPTAHGGRAEDAFHVVCPSLPGFGLSTAPEAPGWTVGRIAAAWAALMERLGHPRFLAHGGDWGGLVTMALAAHHPDRLLGIHLNGVTMPLNPAGDSDLTAAEERAVADLSEFQQVGAGYVALQSTRPQTVGYALADSPTGQAAWIAEKYWSWTDHDGNLEDVVSRTALLDMITWYWLTNTAATSARIYWEHRKAAQGAAADLPVVAVPAAVSVYPREIRRHSQRWLEPTFADLRFFEEPTRGGHFPALEQPATFVDQVRRAALAMSG